MDERRRFERVTLPETAKVFAVDSEGKRLGPVRMIGEGGLLVETTHPFADGSPHEISIVEQAEGIHRQVTVVTRYTRTEGVGFQFKSLDVDAAVEIGVLIGKYYSAARGAKA
jgi:hypothetical protein